MSFICGLFYRVGFLDNFREDRFAPFLTAELEETFFLEFPIQGVLAQCSLALPPRLRGRPFHRVVMDAFFHGHCGLPH